MIQWKTEIDEKVKLPNGNPLPVVLLGNKCDLDTAATVDPAQIERFCNERGFIKAFDVSAKTNINIDKAARSLVEAIMKQKETLFQQKRATQVSTLRYEEKR